MCELFGANHADKGMVNDLLKEFFTHGVTNPHGWGIASFYGRSISVEKQPEAAHESKYLRQRLSADISADSLLAHIRHATVGSLEYENSHPFVMEDESGRDWTLIHNGTIFECDLLNKYVSLQKGQTDSERILHYLVDRMNEAMWDGDVKITISPEDRFRIFDRLVDDITDGNKVNLLIYDGDYMYMHTNYKDSLNICQKGDGVIVSTRPLDDDVWRPLPLNTPVAYKDGKEVYRGHDHGHEFIDSEEKMKYLFLDYSGL